MTKANFFHSLSRFFVSRDLGTRDISIDALRGLAIIGMILVNHRPPTTDVYAFLSHAPLVGWTFADTIFPLFLFLVGVSISFSGKGHRNGRISVPYSRLARRTLLLVIISIALVNFPYYAFDTLIIHGTLFRIAVCYLAAVLIARHCSWRAQLAIAGSIVVAQWWLLTQYAVPGVGPAVFTIDGNASVHLDRLVFGTAADRLVLNGPVSQGVLPTASAVSTTLIGSAAGYWLHTVPESGRKNLQILAAGMALVVLGSLWGLSYPVSKPLWTGSYVVLMSGLSMVALASFKGLLRVPGLAVVAVPFRIAGVNALFFYVFAQSLQRVLVYVRVDAADGTSTRLRDLVYEQWVVWAGDGKASALLYALIYLAICYLVVYGLYRRRIFVKL